MLQRRVQQADSFYDASCDEALSRYCWRFGLNPRSRMTGWFCFTFNLLKWSSMQRNRKKIDCVLDASLTAELEKWFLFLTFLLPYFLFSLPFYFIVCCRLFVRFYDFASCLSLRFFAFTFSQVVEMQLSPYSRLRYDAHSTSRLLLVSSILFFCSATGGS